MELKEKITGLIITFNEEKNIQEIIDNFSICDEIIVVDSFSSDQTVEIAKQNLKVKVIQHRFEDFTKQRNIALDAATNDWVLFLDGDERIPTDLQKEIIAELNPTKKRLTIFIESFILQENLSIFLVPKMIRIFAFSVEVNADMLLIKKFTKHSS